MSHTPKLLAAALVAGVVLAPLAHADTLIIDGTRSSAQWTQVVNAVTGSHIPTTAPPVVAGTTHVDYAASIWPLSGMDQPFLGPSVDAGTKATISQLGALTGHTEVRALSQGALVGHAVQNGMPAGADVTFSYYGDPINTSGGILHEVPINFEGYSDGGIKASPYKTNEVINQYDAVSDFPTYWFANPVADINAGLGFALYNRHNDYSLGTPVGGPGVVVTQQGNTTTYFHTDPNLPIAQALVQVGVPKAVVAAVEPTLRKIVEAGYAPSVVRGTALKPHRAPHQSPAAHKAHVSTKGHAAS
jgi:hypothetical protein